ncbi:phage holin family protein [Chryseobacterium lathyri]|uniref:phage holin family protein n=1 Tax=Chryseobacterium lathyri TaxID=395933 RepID=UPI001CBFF81C|nr:phage holin family protein [Chryseobacterium lathyri]
MIKEFIIKNLLSIHSGGLGGKIWASLQLAAVPAVGFTISERLSGWYIESYVFIWMLGFALIADLIIGIWKHMKSGSFSPKMMIMGFCQKIGLVILVYFLTEAFIQIIADADLDSVYFKVATKLMIFIYPAGNALVNVGIITNGKFPPLGFLTKFEKFNKTLDVNVFKQKQDEKDIDSNTPE